MFPINANHWGEKHSANKTQSLDPGCKAAGPSCLIAVRILASPGVCLDLEEGLGQQLSVLCGPDCKQSGHAAEGQLRQSLLGVDRKENRGPLRVERIQLCESPMTAAVFVRSVGVGLGLNFQV